MYKVLDVFKIPNANISSIILSGDYPKHINNKYKVKKGNLIIPLENITIGRENQDKKIKSFGISVKGNDIKNGDLIEFIE